jgi:hypothetical protein
MIYPDGQEMRLGDRIEHDGDTGRIVALIGEGAFAPEYPAAQWQYLERGALILFDVRGLVHDPQPDGAIRLVARAATR